MSSALDTAKLVFTGEEPEAPATWRREGRVNRVLESRAFDYSMGAIIVVNSITIGTEQTLRLQGGDTSWVEMVEHFFLVVYTLELAMNLYVRGLWAFADNWIRFDLFLVISGVVTQWVLAAFDDDIVEAVGFLMVLRTARLMRLARTVRLLLRFKELWMLVRGLINSASTMLYTLLMLFIILYIFSCIAIELITMHRLSIGPDASPAFQALVAEYFPSLMGTMLTLTQFVALDNIVSIYRPLIEADPWLIIYFVGLILVVGIVLMNLVTAVIVNSALEQAVQDKDLLKTMEEQRKKKLIKDLRRIFTRLDEDGSGQLSRHEVEHVDEQDRDVLSQLMTLKDPVEIFDALDVDGSGDIGIDEFCDGIWQVAVSNAPLEIKRIEKQVDALRSQMAESRQAQRQLLQLVGEVRQTMAGFGSGATESAHGTPRVSELIEEARHLRTLLAETVEAAEAARAAATAASMAAVGAARGPRPTAPQEPPSAAARPLSPSRGVAVAPHFQQPPQPGLGPRRRPRRRVPALVRALDGCWIDGAGARRLVSSGRCLASGSEEDILCVDGEVTLKGLRLLSLCPHTITWERLHQKGETSLWTRQREVVSALGEPSGSAGDAEVESPPVWVAELLEDLRQSICARIARVQHLEIDDEGVADEHAIGLGMASNNSWKSGPISRDIALGPVMVYA